MLSGVAAVPASASEVEKDLWIGLCEVNIHNLSADKNSPLEGSVFSFKTDDPQFVGTNFKAANDYAVKIDRQIDQVYIDADKKFPVSKAAAEPTLSPSKDDLEEVNELDAPTADDIEPTSKNVDPDKGKQEFIDSELKKIYSSTPGIIDRTATVVTNKKGLGRASLFFVAPNGIFDRDEVCGNIKVKHESAPDGYKSDWSKSLNNSNMGSKEILVGSDPVDHHFLQATFKTQVVKSVRAALPTTESTSTESAKPVVPVAKPEKPKQTSTPTAKPEIKGELTVQKQAVKTPVAEEVPELAETGPNTGFLLIAGTLAAVGSALLVLRRKMSRSH